MITVVARWETDQMPFQLEWRMWRQLKNFGIDRFVFVPIAEELSNVDIEQYETMEEALSVVEGTRVFCEPKGTKGMRDLPCRDEDVTLIFGSTSLTNMSYAKEGESYRIEEPRQTDMYPVSAGAVVLAFWHGQ